MQINYTAEPTAARFHASTKVCRGFMGPVGNGKSVACIMEGFRICADQWPNSQGIRKSRFVIVRNTSIELRTTTLKTFQQWIRKELCPIALNPVITGTFRQKLGDGTKMEMEVIFLAMDREDDVQKVSSMETTVIFINECKFIPYAIVKAAKERIGRYPSPIDGYEDVYDGDTLVFDAPKERNPDGTAKIYGPEIEALEGKIMYTPCKRKALLMDTNPPPTTHWWYQLAEVGHFKHEENKEAAIKETRRVFEFFRGPPPLLKAAEGKYIPNPKAENIAPLPGQFDYYLDMIGGNTWDHIDVMVLGNYGMIMEGKVVYPQYNDRVHCPEKRIGAYRGTSICLGWDFGLTPACVIGQLTDTGQCRILHELTSEDMNIYELARDIVKPFLQRHYKDWDIGFSLGDPSGNKRGEGEGRAALDVLNDELVTVINEEGDEELLNIPPLNMGFTTEGAPTNDPTLRINAVQGFMLKLCGGGEPGYVLNKDCEVLRKGKMGGYHYKTIQGSNGLTKDKPNKNDFSHPADAEQYLCLGFQGGYVTDSNEDWEDEDDGPRDTGVMGN